MEHPERGYELCRPAAGAKGILRRVRDVHTWLQRATEGEAGADGSGTDQRRVLPPSGGEGAVRREVHKDPVGVAGFEDTVRNVESGHDRRGSGVNENSYCRLYDCNVVALRDELCIAVALTRAHDV